MAFSNFGEILMHNDNIDDYLLSLCTPENIKSIYLSYKKVKLDTLLAKNRPTVVDKLREGGTSEEEIANLHPALHVLPYEETITFTDRNGKVVKKSLISIPMGADGVTYQDFEKRLENGYAEQLAQRLQNGKYLFYPFREIVILKKPPSINYRPTRKELFEARERDEVRILAVASIRDVLVQNILYEVIRPKVEGLFISLDKSTKHNPKPVSFAYRKGKSAPQAARIAYHHMKNGFLYVLNADLRRFFDTIPTNNLLAICAKYVGSDTLTFKLLRRFITVDRVEYFSYNWAKDDQGNRVSERIFTLRKPRFYEGKYKLNQPQKVPRKAGVPQGGVLSGLLANLYLHDFDEWVINELAKEIPIRYVRYADDFIILAKFEKDLPVVYEKIYSKLTSPFEKGGLELQMHPIDYNDPYNPKGKTHYVDMRRSSIKFVGFQITPNKLCIHPDNIRRFKERWIEVVKSEETMRIEIRKPKKRLRRLIRKLSYKIHGQVELVPCTETEETWEKRRSWINFFAASEDIRQIKKLDSWMRRQIYSQFRESLPNLTNKDLRRLGLPSLVRAYYHIRETKPPCLPKKP